MDNEVRLTGAILECVINLFRSKYRIRIETKIIQLTEYLSGVESEKSRLKQTLSPKEYCHYDLLSNDYQKQIALLKGLL